MVLRVKPTRTRFPTKSIYTPMDNTPLHSISCVFHPWAGCCCRWGMAPRACSKVFGFFTLKALLPYPSHAIVMRLHRRDVTYAVILIPKTVDLLGL